MGKLVLSKLISLSYGGKAMAEFASLLRVEMQSRGLNTSAHLQVVVGRPSAAAPTATHMFLQKRGSVSASGGLSPTLATIMICVACVITACVCALLACLWWQHKRRRLLCPESIWQAQVADTAQDANGSFQASGGVKTCDPTQDADGLYPASAWAKTSDTLPGVSGLRAAAKMKDEMKQDNEIPAS